MKPKALDLPSGKSCIMCGFLASNDPDDEVSLETRRLIGLWELAGLNLDYAAGLRCRKGMWLDYHLHYSGDSADGVQTELEQSRDLCAGFFAHSPGYSPKAHFERQEQERREAVQFSLAWLGLKGSFVAGIVGGTVVRLVEYAPQIWKWLRAIWP